MDIYIFLLILSHLLVFTLASIFFHYSNKNIYRDSTKEIDDLNKENKKLK